jgi:hypothetical protein
LNYATLFETIKGYVENDFPNTTWTDSAGTGTVTLTSTEQINTFIQETEQRVYNMVQLLDLRILGPTPDANYAVELHYFYYPQSIVTAGTSWLGDNFDSVLLYGALLEAYTFMKGEADVIAGYQKRYDEAMGMLKQLGEGKNRQDMYRTQQIRQPVR